MIQDVKLAVNGRADVELVNKGVGAPPSPEEIAQRVEELI